jgi:hypothetical protein
MELVDLAQTSADTYRAVGVAHGWRKGRNSSRGYDALTIPLDAWDDRPQQRYLALLDRHLSSAANQLSACASSARAQNWVAVVTLAREVFVDSSKATWLLDDDASWIRRAARAHLELFAEVDDYVRRLPKRVESGHPNFVRRQWKEERERVHADVIVPLFGKRALAGKRDETMLAGEALLTATRLRDEFSTLLRERGGMSSAAAGAALALLFDPPSDVEPVTRIQGDPIEAESAIGVACDAWLRALGAWVRYNAWDEGVVTGLQRQLLARP